MKSIISNKIKKEFGLKKIEGKKVELYNFYELVGYYKRLTAGEVIK